MTPLLTYLDIIGTIFFAISGTISSANRKFDLLGAAMVGFITAIGGGTLRDIILGCGVCWIVNVEYIYYIFGGILLAFIFKNYFVRWTNAFFIFDTVGIAVYAIIGTNKALIYGHPEIVAILMAIITSVTGGVIRDIINNEVPLILQKEIYVSACVIGSLIFIGLKKLDVNLNFNLIITILVIITIRVIVMKFHIKVPVLKVK